MSPLFDTWYSKQRGGLAENMADLPTWCDVGTKINAKGDKPSTKCILIHIDSFVTTSGSHPWW
jgi:hypothetical protein